VFASHFPSDKVQNEAEIRGSTPVSANDWGKNTTAVAVLIEFALISQWLSASRGQSSDNNNSLENALRARTHGSTLSRRYRITAISPHAGNNYHFCH
jgi:hypothetical protein